MTEDDHSRTGVGRRVRAARKLAPGLTQAALAARMHVSTSLVKAVEQGRVPASPAFVAAAARALSMTVYDLYEQPTPRFGVERAGVSECRRLRSWPDRLSLAMPPE